jgi:AhpC/TSA antioxidant enzyme
VPTSITIIGFGSPSLLPVYRRLTGIPFAMFTDPTRNLYRLLDMGWSLNMGPRPKYFNNVNEVAWIWGQIMQMKKEEKTVRFKGGGWWWVGGEFLIREEKPIWCHRMSSYRDHTDVDVIKRIVGADD